MDAPFVFDKDHMTKAFISDEIHWVMDSLKVSQLDRDGVRCLLKRLHNNIVPDESTLDVFFKSGKKELGLDEIMDIVFTIPIPNVLIKESPILPKEQMEITPLAIPNTAAVQYDNIDFVNEKAGMLNKGFKHFLGKSSHPRFCVVNSSDFSIYEKANRETLRKKFTLDQIQSITLLDQEKSGYPFVLNVAENEVTLFSDDEQTRKEWVTAIATFCLLEMVSTNKFNRERMEALVQVGANVNASYGRVDPRPVLYHLIKSGHMEEAEWLLQHGAHPNCLLRWEFVVNEKLMSPKDLLALLIKLKDQYKVIDSLCLRSDDGFRMIIMHYLCYFGCLKEIESIYNTNESQGLLNDPTYNNDIALTITLLAPSVPLATKISIARLIYAGSNLTTCNRSSQNPVQLTMLMGQMGLLFSMLPQASNVRYDRFNNTILHLAIKAGLPTVARYILRNNNYGGIDLQDIAKDTVLTLAIKANEEDLACEILRDRADATRVCNDWKMENSQHDKPLHQAMKRDMQRLAIDICQKFGGFLDKDTDGNLPIHIALLHRLNDCVKYLVTSEHASLFINTPNESDQDTPLHLALKLGFFDHSMLLIENRANVNAVNRSNLSPCHILVMVAKGDFKSIAKETMTHDQIRTLMDALLKKKPDLEILSNQTNEGRETCVHMAIRGGDQTEELAEMCLNTEKKLVNMRDSDGATPLLLAVQYHNFHLVQLLVDSSDKNVMNADRDTPLHIAVRAGDVDIVSILVDKGAYRRIWNAEGLCPIHLAVLANNLPVLNALKSDIIELNLRTKAGFTPIMLAIQQGFFPVADYLLQYGGDPYLLDNQGRSCLTILAEAIRSAPDQSPFAPLARRFLEFAMDYRLDFFGSQEAIDSDITTISDCEKKGIADGRLPQQESVPVQSFDSRLQHQESTPVQHFDDTEDRFNYPADYTNSPTAPYEQTAQYSGTMQTPYNALAVTPDASAPQAYPNDSAAQPYATVQSFVSTQEPYQPSLPQVGYAPESVQPSTPEMAQPQESQPVAPMSVSAGTAESKKEQVSELRARLEQLQSILRDQEQDLQSLANEEEKELGLLQRQAQEKIEAHIQTPKGRDALEKAIDRLLSRGANREDATNKAICFFVERVKKTEQEQLIKRFADEKQKITQRRAQTEKEIMEIEESLRMIEG